MGNCKNCKNYESGDYTVGLADVCDADFMYDDDGIFLEDVADEVCSKYLNTNKICPYFEMMKGEL